MKKHFLTSLFLGFTLVTINGQNSINGIVLDRDGLPLVGVQVAEVGNKNSFLTDFNGNFRINETKDKELEFRYLGYNAKKVGVSENNTLTVVLERDTIANEDWIKEVDNFFDNNHWNKRPALYQADYNASLVKKNIQDLRFYQEVLAQISMLYTDASDKNEDTLKEEEFLQMGIGKFLAEGLTDEERAKILAKFSCLNAKKGVSGLEHIRKSLYSLHDIHTVGSEFCWHMMSDKRNMVDGNYKDIQLDSTALTVYQRRVVEACYPPELRKEKGPENPHGRTISQYASILDGPAKQDFHTLLRILPQVFPELFKCGDHIGYEEGHIYITMFDKELFLINRIPRGSASGVAY